MEKHKGVYSQRGDDYLLEAWKVCEKEKPAPRCPYCGHKMLHQYAYGDHFFCCPKCRAVASDKAEKPAYTAAMQRWQESNRVLTMEEVREHCKQGVDAAPLWVEFSGFPSESHWMVVDLPDEVFCTDTVRNFCMSYVNTYKKSWRCWLRKPTQEEMEAVPWGGTIERREVIVPAIRAMDKEKSDDD